MVAAFAVSSWRSAQQQLANFHETQICKTEDADWKVIFRPLNLLKLYLWHPLGCLSALLGIFPGADRLILALPSIDREPTTNSTVQAARRTGRRSSSISDNTL